MRILIAILTTLIISFLGCKEKQSTSDEKIILSQTNWLKNKGLTNVESVVYDSTTETFYVSCGKTYQKGTEGFISKISGKGELLNLKWIDSLSRPTGMAIHDRKLFVADIDHLVVIDLDKGEVVNRYKEPVENSGLNDVAVSPSGEVYVSASAKSAVYKLEADTLRIWLTDEAKLKWANGVEVSGDRLLVGGEILSSIDIKTGKISSVPHPSDLRDIEGIALDGKGGYYLTTVDNSALWHLNQEGEATSLLKDGDYLGDLEVAQPDRLIIPRGNHEEQEYYLSYIELVEDR